jgi:hypothetical protein
MLKWAASFTLNRLFALAVLWLAVNAYTRSSCQAGLSLTDLVEQARSGLKQISHALE